MAIKLSTHTLFEKSTFKHLRFHFSFFLMPVFLFALSQAGEINWTTTTIAFIILHLLIFPSSNGYNSYQDKDESSIGGLKNPPKVTENLFYVTLLMDCVGILSGLFISVYFSLFVLMFVCASRAYSYRKIRLKKYPVSGFLIVFIFQGGFVYLMSYFSVTLSVLQTLSFNNIICMCASSLFIGSLYPLTQIYQHEADKKDGVITISYKLGYMGTFIFSAILFLVANLLLIYYFNLKQHSLDLFLFLIIMLPVVFYFFIWFFKVWKDTKQANFENTMNMNLITSACMNSYFLILVLNNIYSWF